MEPAIYGALGALLGGGVAFVGFWMKIGTRLAAGEAAKQIAEDAERKADKIAQQLNDHKVETASAVAALRTIAEETAKTLANAEMRLVKSIDDLCARFDHFTDRLDNVLATILKRSEQPTSRRTKS